MSVLSMFFAEL